MNASGSVYLGVPRERFYIPAFVDNRDKIIHHLNGLDRLTGIYQAESHRVDRNRDRIVRAFLGESDAEWLLMLDSDMDHPVDCGVRLSAWEKPVVGALYFHRGRRHDPLIFKKIGRQEDEFGRMTQHWEPVRDSVYEFFTKYNVPRRDGALTIGNQPEGSLIEVDAVGTGCMIIHRSVLEQMDPPWFEYRDGSQSEDLEFCDRVRNELGLPVYADLSTVCGHFRHVAMGQAQFRMLYEARGHSLTGYTREEISELIARFLDIPVETAMERLKDYHPKQMHELWEEHKDDPEAFYKNPDVGTLYLYDLASWNMSPTFANFRNMLTNYRGRRVLEIGSGIGTVSMQMAIQQCDVTSVEPNNVLRMFSGHYRWPHIQENITGKRGQIEFVESIDEVGGGYELVVAIDVFEHLKEQQLQEMLTKISSRMLPGARLFAHNNWKQQDLFPFHFDHGDQRYETWLRERGLYPLDKLWSMKL